MSPNPMRFNSLFTEPTSSSMLISPNLEEPFLRLTDKGHCPGQAEALRAALTAMEKQNHRGEQCVSHTFLQNGCV